MSESSFRLVSPDDEGRLWKLIVHLRTNIGPADFNVDLSDNGVHVSFQTEDPPIRYALPPEVPRILIGSARVQFSRKHHRLSIEWMQCEEGSGDSSTEAKRNQGPCEGDGRCLTSTSTSDLDVRIEALRQDLTSNVKIRPKSSAFEERLAQAIAGQISKLFASTGPAGGDAEHLADVVNTALEMSGQAYEAVERAKLILKVGQYLSASAHKLRLHCFERAVTALDEDIATTSASKACQLSCSILRSEALYHAGLEMEELGDRVAAQGKLSSALKMLGSSKTDEIDTLRIQIRHALANICSRGGLIAEASTHVTAADKLCQERKARHAAEQAEISAGFAATLESKRLPIQNYSYSDDERALTVRIKLDEALFVGAADYVTSKARHVQAIFDEHGGGKAVELRVAAPPVFGSKELACWVLRLAPLFRPVRLETVEIRLQRGTVSMVLQKQEASFWPDGPVRR